MVSDKERLENIKHCFIEYRTISNEDLAWLLWRLKKLSDENKRLKEEKEDDDLQAKADGAYQEYLEGE